MNYVCKDFIDFEMTLTDNSIKINKHTHIALLQIESIKLIVLKLTSHIFHRIKTLKYTFFLTNHVCEA